MGIAELRSKLHEYIDTADERHLQAIYVLVQKEEESGYVYDEATLYELERRRTNHKSGKSKSYTAEEALDMVKKQKK